MAHGLPVWRSPPHLAFGKYPEVTLAEARDKRLEARKLLDQGTDTSQDKEERQRELREANGNTFEKLAREWHSNKLPTWSVATERDIIRRLEIDIFPQIGSMPIGAVKHQHVIQRFNTAYADGKRLVAYVIAGELTERGIPPCFWHEVLALDGTSTAQREVLTLADLAWLRRWHPEHASAVRYQRGKALITQPASRHCLTAPL